jgi:sugar transferase (PEP-CTERM/EpsH1 system associated)
MAEIPLIVHLTYALDCGGLENLLVERINRMPVDRYRHAVICLTRYTDFAKRIARPDVGLHALDKPPGLAAGTHLSLWKLLRRLRPTILHTYNLAAIEYGLTGLLAGVPVRVNGAHGREASDPEGRSRKHNLLRKLLVPLYDMCYANSRELYNWNKTVIGVPDLKSRLLDNGIDVEHFGVGGGRARPPGMPAFPADAIVIGSVGRLHDVKNHALLIDAFARLRAQLPAMCSRLHLVIVGSGPLLGPLTDQVARMGLAEHAWLPGMRTDIADILATLSVFALPSIAEGTPGSVLEAMAAGLPVVATRVGGIPDVVTDGETGRLVPSQDVTALAAALAAYCTAPELARQHGAAGRQRVGQRFAMASMVAAYTTMYDDLCKIKHQGAYQPCAE